MDVAAAVGAAVGGGVSTLVLYPLDVLRTRWASGQKVDVGELYSGVLPKLAQSMLGKLLYFAGKSALVEGTGSTTALGDLACGYLAEMGHLPLTVPIEVAVTRLQSSEEGEGFGEIWRRGGLYTGWRVYPFLCVQPAIQYTVYEKLRVAYAPGSSSLSASTAFFLGAFARAVALLVTFPFTRARTIIQGKKKKEYKEEGVGALLFAIIKKEGVGGLYKGLSPELLRGVLSSALMMLVKEKIQVAVGTLLGVYLAKKTK